MQEPDTHTMRSIGGGDMHYLRREFLQRLPELWSWFEQGAVDGWWFWDLRNPEHEYFDARFWSTLGYDPATQAHSPRAWQGIIHPEDLPRALQDYEAHLADSDFLYDMVTRYRAGPARRGVAWVWVRCRGRIVLDGEIPLFMLGVHQDVTELVGKLRELEARLLRLENDS